MRQAAEHLVLAADQVARRPASGRTSTRCRSCAQKPSASPGWPCRPAPDRGARTMPQNRLLRHLGVGQDRGGRVAGRDRRDVHQPGAQAAAGGPAAAPPGPPGARTAPDPNRCRCGQPPVPPRRWGRTPASQRARTQQARTRPAGRDPATGPAARTPAARTPAGRAPERPRWPRGRRGQPAHRAVAAVDGAGAPGPGTRGRGHGHDRRLRPLSARTACW